MSDRQSWRPVLFQCPRTGEMVQGLISGEASSANPEDYEAVSCHACAAVHFVNAFTGTVLGVSREGSS